MAKTTSTRWRHYPSCSLYTQYCLLLCIYTLSMESTLLAICLRINFFLHLYTFNISYELLTIHTYMYTYIHTPARTFLGVFLPGVFLVADSGVAPGRTVPAISWRCTRRTRVEFQRFLMALSVRPGSCFAITAHLWPFTWCSCGGGVGWV